MESLRVHQNLQVCKESFASWSHVQSVVADLITHRTTVHTLVIGDIHVG